MSELPKNNGENGANNGSAASNPWEQMSQDVQFDGTPIAEKLSEEEYRKQNASGENEQQDLTGETAEEDGEDVDYLSTLRTYLETPETEFEEKLFPYLRKDDDIVHQTMKDIPSRREGESATEFEERINGELVKKLADTTAEHIVFGSDDPRDSWNLSDSDTRALALLYPRDDNESIHDWCSRIAEDLAKNVRQFNAEHRSLDALGGIVTRSMQAMLDRAGIDPEITQEDVDFRKKQLEWIEQQNDFMKRRDELQPSDGPKYFFQNEKWQDAVFGSIAKEQADENRNLSEYEEREVRHIMPQEPGESEAEYSKRLAERFGIRLGSFEGQPAMQSESNNSGAVSEEQPVAQVEGNNSGVAAEGQQDAQVEGEGERGFSLVGGVENGSENAEKIEREDFDARVADAKSKLEKMTYFDGSVESDEDYERRMRHAVFSDIRTEMSQPGSTRELTKTELAELVGLYPRKENENDEAWTKRINEESGIAIGIDSAKRAEMNIDKGGDHVEHVSGVVIEDGDEENDSNDSFEGNAETSAEKHARAENMRRIFKSPIMENLLKTYNQSPDDLVKASDDDILRVREFYGQQLEEWATKSKEQGGAGLSQEDLKKLNESGGQALENLMWRFNAYLGIKLKENEAKGVNKSGEAKDDGQDKSSEKKESAEDAEKARRRLVRSTDIPDLRDFMKDEYLINKSVQDMSTEELKDLRERLRKRMAGSMSIEEARDILGNKDLKEEDFKDLSFEELRDAREKLREKFMDDIDVYERSGKLKGWKIDVSKMENMTLEQLRDLKKRIEEKDKAKEKDPLLAMMIDRERDAEVAAEALAQELLDKRVEGNGKSKLGKAVRNWFFKTLLKDYEEERYKRIALDALKDKKDKVESDGYSVDVKNYWSYNGDGAGGKLVERMTLAYTRGIEKSLIHSANGDSMSTYGVETDENGKQVVFKYSEGGNKKEAVDANSAESKSTIAIHEAIASYATGKMKESDFREAVNRAKADMAKEGHENDLMIDTLFATACAAKERFEHESSIDEVMSGFRLINADYQARERTEAHRSKIDQLVRKYETSRFGSIVKPEIVAAAAGIITVLGQSGARTASNVIAPLFGGAAVGGFFAGLREHEHVASDRAEQARRLARGETAGDSKYDKQMQEAMYETYKANDLADGLKKAIESGNIAELQQGLAMVEALNQVSDSKKIDLITFSGGDVTTMEDERLALDVQIAEAKVALRKQGIADNSKSFVDASRKAFEVINNDIDAKDEVFKKLQTKRVAAQAAKTAAFGVAFGLGMQEATAVVDPNSYGLFDKLNDKLNIRFEPFNIGVNNLDAHKTLLAGWLGINQEKVVSVVEQVRAAEATGAKLTDEQAEALRKEGYTVTERDVTSTQQVTRTENVSASEYARENGISIKRNWGNNGTEKIYEGNELGLHQASDGHLYTRMSGDSFSSTQTVNFEQAAQSGNVKLLLSLTRDSQGTPIEIPGVLNAQGQLDFISSDPAINEIIASGKYAFAEVAYDTGQLAANGAEKMFIFATDVGSNSVSDTLTRTVTDTIVSHDTVFDVVGFDRMADKIMQGSDLVDGAVALPFAGRKNLTRGKRGKNHGPRTTPKPTDPKPPVGPKPEPKPPVEKPKETKQVGPTPPKPQLPEQKPSGAPQLEQKPSGAPQLEQKPEGEQQPEGFESAVDLGEPYGNMVTRVEFTDEEIDALEPNEKFREDLKKAIALWNSASEEERRRYITGNGEKGDMFNADTMLRNLGKSYIGSVEDVTRLRAQAREAAKAKRAAEMKAQADAEAKAKAEAEKEEAESAEMMLEADSYQPITDPSDLRNIMVSDKRIKELNPNNEPTDEDIKTIRVVLTGWNRLDPSDRKKLLEGKYNGLTNNPQLNKYMEVNFGILKKFNIIALPDAGAAADNGQAPAAAEAQANGETGEAA